eukprot:TRINITY_DN14617_c0_g1_i1.p1 TRINITY_DN14617_c0_g1~~TRINITY_DN14617_c0_g1_i1.p1  ORF type:complete len:187 (+),score=43.50 TRINITY_DN14617_c0_g1_i1:296-856(+)
MRRFYESFLAVRKLPVPVISAINGPAIGAGCCLALATDLRVASAEAKLGVTFVRLGLHPGMGATHFLPSIVGAQEASKMILTGEVIDGREAHARGLVTKVSETGDATLEDAVAMAEEIAAQAPVAVRAATRTLRIGQEDGLERALWREADAQAQTWNSADLKEGLDALVDKRVPEFNQFETYGQNL